MSKLLINAFRFTLSACNQQTSTYSFVEVLNITTCTSGSHKKSFCTREQKFAFKLFSDSVWIHNLACSHIEHNPKKRISCERCLKMESPGLLDRLKCA